MERSDDVRRGVPGWLLPGEFLAGGGPGGVRRTARDWVVDAGVFAVAVLLGLVVSGIVQKYDHPAAGLVAADLLLGALACVSLWWRRRFPLAVALLALPAVAVSNGAFGANIVIIANLALRVPWRRSLPVLGLYLAVSFAGVLLLQGVNADGLFGMAFALAYCLVCFAWGSTLRARRLWTLAVRKEAELEREEHARRLASARRVEREAIAREMHDVLAHRLSLLSVHAGALAYRTDQSTVGSGPGLTDVEISGSAQIIRDNAHQALAELQEVLLVLRVDDVDQPVAPQPRLTDLPALVQEARAAGQRVEFRDELGGGEADALRAQGQRTIYRVVQEGLTNARKHAPDAEVTVLLVGEPGADLTVEISNAVAAGEAGSRIPGAGAGLAGLAERVRLEGGEMEHGRVGEVFTLRVRLPWPVA